MTENLEARRAEVEGKLVELRIAPKVGELVRQADEAVKVFKGEVAALEAELGEIDRTIGARELARREAAGKQREEEWLAQRRQLLDLEEQRLQALANAQAAARALVKAINVVFGANKQMTTLARSLSLDRKVPAALSERELEARMAGRLAATMGTIDGHRYRFGPIEWPGGPAGLYAPERSWRDEEEALAAKQLLQPLLENGKA
jgi:hypothetical protein